MAGRDIIFAGGDWHPAFVALILASRLPGSSIKLALPDGISGQQLEPFIFEELTDDVTSIIADAVVREWPEFAIAGGGQIKRTNMAAGVLDPSQLIVDALHKLPSVPAQAAHWVSSPSPSAIWIDVPSLLEMPDSLYTIPTTISRWVDWDGAAHVPYLVLADFNDAEPDRHRQYLPLVTNRLMVRTITHGTVAENIDFTLAPANVAKQYLQQWPSNLARLSHLAGCLEPILAAATS